MTDAEWDAVIDVHLRGSYLATKHAWQQMLQGEGVVYHDRSTRDSLATLDRLTMAQLKQGWPVLYGFLHLRA